MDIGKVVSWIQLLIWVVAVFLYVGKLLITGGLAPSSLLGRLFSSNLVLGLMVLSGLATSLVVLYLNLNLAKYRFNKSSKLKEINNQVFMNESVVLDGKLFKHCKFQNATYKYNGRRGVGLQNCTFAGSRRISSDSDAVNGAWIIAKGLGLMESVAFLGPEGQPRSNISNPQTADSTKPNSGDRSAGKVK